MALKDKSRTKNIVLGLSLLTAVFWSLSQMLNVYTYAVVGAVFEILWLPMLGLLISLPVISLIYWAKEYFSIKSSYLYSLLLILATFLFMFLNGIAEN